VPQGQFRAIYSEGIYEDINKVICGQSYWDTDRAALDTVSEYAPFEYWPDVVDSPCQSELSLSRFS
jgi:hypothetical protein